MKIAEKNDIKGSDKANSFLYFVWKIWIDMELQWDSIFNERNS